MYRVPAVQGCNAALCVWSDGEQRCTEGERKLVPNWPLQVVIVQNASLEGQRVWQGTVGSIVEQTAGEALSPCIVIVGEVCRLAALDQQDEILERLV